jgi:hypothetical protein
MPLIEAGHPDQPITVNDAATGRLAILVMPIAAATELSADEHRDSRFAKWKLFERSSLDE